MTKEEIEGHFLGQFGCNPTEMYGKREVDFALDMVRKHNEECAKIAENLLSEHFAPNVQRAIREVKP